MEEHEINFYGIKLLVKGDYQVGCLETRDEPSEPQGFDIHEVIHEGEDIEYLISEDNIRKIEYQILEEFYS